MAKDLLERSFLLLSLNPNTGARGHRADNLLATNYNPNTSRKEKLGDIGITASCGFKLGRKVQ
jgi:hypothetical protein